jgi:chemotaxis protein CheX
MSEHIRTEEVSGCRVIRCLTDLSDGMIPQLAAAIADLCASVESGGPKSALVVDLANHGGLDARFFRLIAPVGMRLKRHQKRIYLIGAQPAFARQVAESGMDGMLCLAEDLAQVLSDLDPAGAQPPRAQPRVDAEFLNLFINAVISTLGTQCSTQVRPGKVQVHAGGSGATNAPARPACDIAGIIGLASDAFLGTIAICYPKSTFLGLIGRMLGESYAEITQDLEDGAAELLNIIFGQAKVGLNEKGYEIQRAIPTTIRGDAIERRHPPSLPSMRIPFDSDAGPFSIEIAIETSPQRSASHDRVA